MKFLGLVALSASVGPAYGLAVKRDGPTIAIPQGTVKGFADKSGNSVFLGIPFAATTGGENRYVMSFRLDLTQPRGNRNTDMSLEPR